MDFTFFLTLLGHACTPTCIDARLSVTQSCGTNNADWFEHRSHKGAPIQPPVEFPGSFCKHEFRQRYTFLSAFFLYY